MDRIKEMSPINPGTSGDKMNVTTGSGIDWGQKGRNKNECIKNK